MQKHENKHKITPNHPKMYYSSQTASNLGHTPPASGLAGTEHTGFVLHELTGIHDVDSGNVVAFFLIL